MFTRVIATSLTFIIFSFHLSLHFVYNDNFFTSSAKNSALTTYFDRGIYSLDLNSYVL